MDDDDDNDDNPKEWRQASWLHWVARIGWTIYVVMFVLIAVLAYVVAGFFDPVILQP